MTGRSIITNMVRLMKHIYIHTLYISMTVEYIGNVKNTLNARIQT